MHPFTILADTIRSENGSIIEPLFLAIHFSGTVDKFLPPRVPIKVFVKLPDDVSNQLFPAVAGDCSLPRDKIQHKYSGLRPQLNTFSFFPLAQCFDYRDKHHWCKLLEEIQCVLLDAEEREDQLRCGGLMLDFFWMAFVAAYPSFPGGEWDAWDAQISMDGLFITSWLGDPGLQQLRESGTPDVIRQFVFDELKESIEHFFPTLIKPSL